MGIEDVVYIHNGILLRHKHNDIIMSFVATLMDLETIILSGVSHKRRTNIWYHLFVESKKYTNEFIYTAEAYSQTQKTIVCLLKRKRSEGGKIRSLGLTYTHYYI